MKLRDYVKLDSAMDTIDQYQDTAKYADLTQPGWKELGNVEVPDMSFLTAITDDYRCKKHLPEDQYYYGRHDKLTEWGKKTFPNVRLQDVRIQMQEPGKKISPHVDSLVGHMAKWIEIDPSIGELEHTMENPNPNLKAVRYFIACEDHVPGQNFTINDKKWIWKKGDAISLNVWRGLHFTNNDSNQDRYIIKITGIEE